MKFDSLVSKITERMKQPLPGVDIQYMMAPQGRKKMSSPEKESQARSSAVLILLYPEMNRIFLPLMKRNVYSGHHSGQVSLPGGKTEEFDASPADTALRETNEELGINTSEIKIVGQLTELFIPVSNFKVVPVIGIDFNRPRFNPDPTEVEELLEVNAEMFLNADLRRSKPMTFNSGIIPEVPYYDIHGHIVWGATAMIMSEFAQVLSDSLDL